jgi:hypothetical protein
MTLMGAILNQVVSKEVLYEKVGMSRDAREEHF